uniref:Uncharacterized protein n=1 Tax=Panagrolaimus superbus TaxID=310955 RepID=A0A914XZ76_9BILA
MAERSKTELGAKIDRCFADSLLKAAGGLAIGIGQGWSNCRDDLQNPYLLHGKKIRVGSEMGKPAYMIQVVDPALKKDF